MLFCKLKDNDTLPDEMMKLCDCQRYCPDEDSYIPHRQEESCKYYN